VRLQDYRVRSQQLEMARTISVAIEKHEILVAEAGTGTGKTYAYLAPALLAGGKVIIFHRHQKPCRTSFFSATSRDARCPEGAGGR